MNRYNIAQQVCVVLWDLETRPFNAMIRSEMTLNCRVTVKRYPFPNGVVGGSIPAVKFSLCLTEKTNQISRKPR